MIRYIANLGNLNDTKLSYTLTKVEDGLVFQVNEQSENITEFLKNGNYRAKNGMLIAASRYPEFKDSEYTLFLRGKDSSHDSKLDVTRFVGNMQRDKRYNQIKDALKEFVSFVKANTKVTPVFVDYDPWSYQWSSHNVVIL